MTAKPSKAGSKPPIKVVDTYLRALRRLTDLRNEVDLLEEGVAEREADALRRILAQVAPLVPELARPISIRAPWADDDHDETYEEHGLVLLRSFEQAQGDGGRITHHDRVLALVGEGRLVEVLMEGAWREGDAPKESSWRVTARPREVTPEFARDHLRQVLAGILDALKEALARGRAERRSLERRLSLLEEVDALLSR